MPLEKDILDWNNQLRAHANEFFNTGQEIVEWMMPSKRDITRQTTPGARRTQRIYDGTAPDSIFLASSFLQGSIFNPASIWLGLKSRVEALNENPAMSEALAEAKKIQLAVYRQTNFYAATLEYLQDWLGFGNACLIQERVQDKRPGLSRIVFCPQGFGSYVFFEGKDKRPEGMIREIEMSAREIIQRWPDTVSQDIRKAEQKNPFDLFCIVHAIVPRETVSYRKIKTPRGMPWASVWVEKEKCVLLEESGYREKPFAIARYNVIAGETMGRGLGELALPPCKTVNMAMQRAFDEWDKVLDPPIDTTQANVIGSYSHRPGSVNVLRRLDGTQVPASVMQMRGRNQTHEWNLEDQRRQIRETFFVEQIRQLIGLQGSPNPEKTAYEFAQRLRLLHLILAPTGGRLQSEGLRDIVDTTFAILFRTGGFPAEIKAIMAEAASTVPGGNEVDITYEGPLAKAQREEDIQAMADAFMQTDVAAQNHPELLDIVDAEKIIREMWEIRGLANFLRERGEYNQIKQLKGQVQQLQAQLAAMQQASEVVKNAAPMVQAMNGQNGQAQ